MAAALIQYPPSGNADTNAFSLVASPKTRRSNPHNPPQHLRNKPRKRHASRSLIPITSSVPLDQPPVTLPTASFRVSGRHAAWAPVAGKSAFARLVTSVPGVTLDELRVASVAAVVLHGDLRAHRGCLVTESSSRGWVLSRGRKSLVLEVLAVTSGVVGRNLACTEVVGHGRVEGGLNTRVTLRPVTGEEEKHVTPRLRVVLAATWRT